MGKIGVYPYGGKVGIIIAIIILRRQAFFVDAKENRSTQFIRLRQRYLFWTSFYFLFSFCLDAKRNKKIKANPNASGRFASQRHWTSMLFMRQFIVHSVFRSPCCVLNCLLQIAGAFFANCKSKMNSTVDAFVKLLWWQGHTLCSYIFFIISSGLV